MWNLIDKGLTRAALVIFFILAAACLLAGTSYDLPKPAPGVEAWFKLFQSVVGVVVGLKIAWNIQSVVSALAARNQQSGPEPKA